MDDIAKRLGVSKGAIYPTSLARGSVRSDVQDSTSGFQRDSVFLIGDEANPIQSATQFFDKMLKLFSIQPGLSFEILAEASRNPSLKRILKQNHEEYELVLTVSFRGQKEKIVGDNLTSVP